VRRVEGINLADIILIVVIPWLIQIERRLSKIEGYLKKLNNSR